MKKQFAVIGLGRFGKSAAVTLSELGHDVLAIDSSEANVQEVIHYVTHAVQADAREEENLRALGLRNFDVAIVAIGNDIEANILITMMLKDMGVKKVVSKAMNALHGKVLEKIGADKIIFPEKDMAVRLAHNLVSQNVLDFMELAPGYSVLEVITPNSFVDKTLGELNLRIKYGVSVMAIKKGDNIIVAPGGDACLGANDVVVIVGKNDDLANLPE